MKYALDCDRVGMHSQIGYDDDDDGKLPDDEDVVDNAVFTLSGHTDSVFSVAVHPTRPNIIASGYSDNSASVSHSI